MEIFKNTIMNVSTAVINAPVWAKVDKCSWRWRDVVWLVEFRRGTTEVAG